MKKNSRFVYHTIVIIIIFMFMAVIFLAGCDIYIDKIALRARKTAASPTLNIGAVWPFESAPKSFFNGLSMASDEINLAGGVIGKKIKLYIRNDESSVTKGMLIADEFAAAPEISAVIGFYNSYITIPVSNIYSNAGILMITTETFHPSFNSFKSPLLFRTTVTSDMIADKITDLIHRLGFKKAAICYVNNSYGLCSANACEDRLKQLSIAVSDRRSYTSAAFEFKSIIESLKLLDFDCILFFGEMHDASNFIKPLRGAGIDVPLISGYDIDYKELVSSEGDYSRGVVSVTLFDPDVPGGAEKKKFIDNYKAIFGVSPDYYAAQVYDTMIILAEAVEKSGSAEPLKIADALASIKNKVGVLGFYEFNEKGDAADKNILFRTISNGGFKYFSSTAEIDLIKDTILSPAKLIKPEVK